MSLETDQQVQLDLDKDLFFKLYISSPLIKFFMEWRRSNLTGKAVLAGY